MVKTNTISINGRAYDARTGRPLHAAKSASRQHAPIAPAKAVRRQPAKPVAPHAPAKSRTLMRHAVRKPTHRPAAPKLKAQGPVQLAGQPLAEVVISRSAVSVDTRRHGRALRVSKSHLIKHFSPPAMVRPEVIAPRFQPVVEAPLKKPTHQSTASPTAELLDRALRNATSHTQPPHHVKRRRLGLRRQRRHAHAV